MIERFVRYIEAAPERQWTNSRHTLAKLAIDAESGRLICYRVAWLQDKGIATSQDAAISRLYSSELLKRAANAAMQLLGLYGQLDKRGSIAPLHGWFEHLYLASIGATICTGTSEIQKM